MHNDLDQPNSSNPRPNARRVREHPYPRSARPHGGSGRATQTDPNCELMMPDEDAYMPRLMGSRVQLLLLRHHQARLYEDGIGRHAHARGHQVQPARAPRWHHRRQESKVYTPLASMTGCTEWVWHLAKAYVNVLAQRATGTHWLNTHAVMMEPCFVIASSPPTSRLDI